jgi:hypothetical protein
VGVGGRPLIVFSSIDSEEELGCAKCQVVTEADFNKGECHYFICPTALDVKKNELVSRKMRGTV